MKHRRMKYEGLHGRKLNKGCRKDSDAGFTLVELLIAVVILAIIVIPLLHMFVTSSRINVRSRQILRATTVAQDIMEGLKAYSLDEVRMQFAPPEGVDPDTVEFYYPSDGFFVINSSMIQGGVREITELGPDHSGEEIYYFGIENIKMQGSEYDALIKLDASTYGSKSKEAIDNTGADGTGALHDNEFNGMFYADIGSVSETAAADESLKATDSSYHEDKNLQKDVLKDIKDQVEGDVVAISGSLPDGWDWDEESENHLKLLKRTIHVLFKDAGTMDAEGNPACSATINITYEYRFEYNGTTRSYEVKVYEGWAGPGLDGIPRAFSSGNFYLFYYPVYTIGSTVDYIEFEFEDADKLFDEEHPLLKSIVLAKQIRADVDTVANVIAPELSDAEFNARESSYCADVSFTGFPAGSDLVFRTNIDTNMAEAAKHKDGDGKYILDPETGEIERDPISGVVLNPPIGTDAHINKLGLAGGNANNKITNVIYDVEITVYRAGAAENFEHALEADFEENYDVHRLAFISSLN